LYTTLLLKFLLIVDFVSILYDVCLLIRLLDLIAIVEDSKLLRHKMFNDTIDGDYCVYILLRNPLIDWMTLSLWIFIKKISIYVTYDWIY